MKAIFLDRDGVINRDPNDGSYITGWEKFEFLPGSLEAIKDLTDNGYDIFIISNQAGVGKGVYTAESLNEITARMIKEIEKSGGRISSVNYCIHKPDEGCDCRKPGNDLIKKAVTGLDVDFGRSYFIGDSRKDIEAGKSMGCMTVLLLTGKENPDKIKDWETKPDITKNNLKEAVQWVLKEKPKL